MERRQKIRAFDYKNYNSYNYYNSYNPMGEYKDFALFKQTEIIYDFTVRFCVKYISKFSRTKDQMEQVGRSGKQNISEGYAQGIYGGKVKLMKVARGNLEELLTDYQDYLRQKNLPLWEKDDPRAKKARSLVYKIKDYKDYNSYNSYNCYNLYKPYLNNPEEAANAMICFINQTNAMLDQKIRWIEENVPMGASRRVRINKEEDDFDRQLQEIVAGKRQKLEEL